MSKDTMSYPEKDAAGKPQCIRCGKPIQPLARKYVEQIYGEGGDVKGLTKLCPKCRRKAAWEGCVLKI